MISNNIIFTSHPNIQQQKETKKKQGPNIKGGIIALSSTAVVSGLNYSINKKIINKIAKYNKSLTPEDHKKIFQQAEGIMDLTRLKEKGLTIKHIEGRQNLTPIPDNIYNLMNPLQSIADGKNSCYSWLDNSIYINKNKMSLPLYHEIGHAFNHLNTSFWKKLQNYRPIVSSLASLISIIPALTKEHKEQNGQKITKTQEIKNKIRNIIPVLSIILTMPIILEEGKASARANQWAKQLLPTRLSNKIKKQNSFGLITYIISSLSIGLSSYCAKVIKDSSDNKRTLNQNIKSK